MSIALFIAGSVILFVGVLLALTRTGETGLNVALMSIGAAIATAATAWHLFQQPAAFDTLIGHLLTGAAVIGLAKLFITLSINDYENTQQTRLGDFRRMFRSHGNG